MTLWVFDISATGPQDVGDQAAEGRVAAGGGRSAGALSTSAVAVEKLRAEAIGRGDPVLEMRGIPEFVSLTILRFLRDPANQVTLVCDNLGHIEIAMRKTEWQIIDARGLSMKDGKVMVNVPFK